MGTYPERLIRDTIKKAGTDWDFELFCARFYTLMEGFNYLPTSRIFVSATSARARSDFIQMR